jgi:hypothetical protein
MNNGRATALLFLASLSGGCQANPAYETSPEPITCEATIAETGGAVVTLDRKAHV